MPSLTVEFGHQRLYGRIRERVTIGRRNTNDIVIADPHVAAVEAWIGEKAGQYFIVGAGGGVGTIVNGKPLGGRHALIDGDRIRVGPARLTFHHGDPPEEFLTTAVGQESFGGILFMCECGTDVYAPARLVGKTGRCPKCDRSLQIPERPPLRPDQLSTAPDRAAIETPPVQKLVAGETAACGVCQWNLSEGDDYLNCPDCGLPFHPDCWIENFGCSAYGCSQVNVLDPASAAEAISEEVGEMPHERPRTVAAMEQDLAAQAAALKSAESFPWDFVLLAASIFALLVGLVTYGFTCMLALACILARFQHNRQRHHESGGALFAALLISLIGVVGGAAMSYFWWHT